jgi:hypothetical protein
MGKQGPLTVEDLRQRFGSGLEMKGLKIRKVDDRDWCAWANAALAYPELVSAGLMPVPSKRAQEAWGTRVTGEPPVKTRIISSSGEARRSSDLVHYLDRSKGTDELYEMLRTRSAAEIEDVCRRFPIENIRLNWGSAGTDARAGDTRAILSEVLSEEGKRDIKRFELITVLAQVFVRYDEILKQSPQLRLPESLPAKNLTQL